MLKRIVNIILILIMFSSCSTLKLSEIIANDILDNINYGGDRYDYSFTNFDKEIERICEVEKIGLDAQTKLLKEFTNEEVRKMEQPEVITMITSIIAGLYAVVKTIINLIKKIKK